MCHRELFESYKSAFGHTYNLRKVSQFHEILDNLTTFRWLPASDLLTVREL